MRMAIAAVDSDEDGLDDMHRQAQGLGATTARKGVGRA